MVSTTSRPATAGRSTRRRPGMTRPRASTSAHTRPSRPPSAFWSASSIPAPPAWSAVTKPRVSAASTPMG